MTDDLSLKFPTGPRRWRVGQESGCVFDEDEDFDGFTLTIALDHWAQADAVAMALRIMLPHWRPSDDSPE